MRLNYKHSYAACCVGYITQSIVINLMPLMFAMFATAYGITLDKIGLLITVSFVVQENIPNRTVPDQILIFFIYDIISRMK